MNKLNEQGYWMNTQQQVELGISAASNFFSIIPTYSSGVATNQAYEYQAWREDQNAATLRRDAQDILSSSYDYENKVRLEGARVKGEQKVAMGASGFEVGSKSYVDLIENTDYNVSRNTAAIRSEAISKYSAVLAKADYMNIQADYMRKAGKIAKHRAKTDAIFNGLIGAVKLGAMSYFGNVEDMGRNPDADWNPAKQPPVRRPKFGG